MEAYNEFLKGRDLYDKNYFEDARQDLQKAIEKDPGFASAHLYMAYAYGGLRFVKQQEEAYKKAKALSDKATEKERLYIEAAYANAVEKDPEKRFRILQELTAKYPREKRAHLSLAAYYRGRKAFPDAIGELGKALELAPDYGGAMELFAYLYMDMGEMEKATEYLKKYTAVNPGDADPYVAMGNFYFRTGGLDQAIASYREALRIKPNFGADEWIAYIQAVKGEYGEALRSIDDYIDKAPGAGIRMRGQWWRAFYNHVTGRRNLAMNEADRAIEGWKSVNPYGATVIKMVEAWFCYDRGEYDKGRRLQQEYFDFNKSSDPAAIRINTSWLEHYLALLDVKQGRIGSAKERIKKATLLLAQEPIERPSWTAQSQRLNKIIQAEISLAEGKAGEVIASFAKGSALAVPVMSPPELLQHNMPLEQDVLARAYQKAGNLDKAIEVYRQLLTYDPASQDRRIRIPVYHYRLGRLYEEKGERERAAEQYRLFLDLWRDADANLPEPADARKRLAGLTVN
jgi:tetratricopeptide (TPR) repeat protein